MTTTQPADTTTQGDQVFPLLADPANYTACLWDLSTQPDMRAYWLGVFRSHFPSLIEEAVHEAAQRGEDGAAVRRRLDAVSIEFLAYLDTLAANPAALGRFDIITVCIQRERLLRQAGIADPYRAAKARENETCLLVLPRLLAELDSTPDHERGRRLIEGVFAGNIFDLGATSTLQLFKDGPVDFHSVRLKLAPRPWLIDNLDPWLALWNAPRNAPRSVPRNVAPRHRQAMLFIDNAGSDIVLGMIPLARELLRRGTRVILAANSAPSLNDVTCPELLDLVARIGKLDATIAAAHADGRLELVPTGNGLPLIDLTRISPELVAATHRTRPDLVILEGMGRGIESNLRTPFTCDSIKIAMIKDQGVADALGGKLYDLVMKYDPV